MDTNMTFRMDSDIKAKMAEICAEIGMSQSTAFNIFAKAFVVHFMPFSAPKSIIFLRVFYNSLTLKTL